jgi:DNA-binding Xre family transcriptional regulator
MKVVRSNLPVLLAQHQQRTGKRLSYRALARETELNEYTVRGFANSTLREYPADAIAKLCHYFKCNIGDLLTLVDEPTQ